MKRTTLALCCFAAAPMAIAQVPSNVTIYGLLDQGVERVNHVGAAGSTVTRLPTLTNTFPNMWGLRGSEDLGGGLIAKFTLEQGFGLDTGALGQAGRAFGRQAHVGLAGSWGEVTFGRQYTMLVYSLIPSNVFGPHVYGLSSFDTYIPNARVDNSFGYRGTFSGFTVGATYSLGRDSVNAGPSPAGTNCPETAGNSKACREQSLLLSYQGGYWGVAVASDRINGGVGAFGGLIASSLSDTRTVVNAFYRTDALTVGAGLIRRKNEASVLTPKSDLSYFNVSYRFAPLFSLDAGVNKLDFKNSANGSTMVSFRGTYSLSKRTAIHASIARMSNSGVSALSVSGGEVSGAVPVAGGSQVGTMVGLRHSF